MEPVSTPRRRSDQQPTEHQTPAQANRQMTSISGGPELSQNTTPEQWPSFADDLVVIVALNLPPKRGSKLLIPVIYELIINAHLSAATA